MPIDFEVGRSWRGPSGWRLARTIDAHTGGEPFRVVIEGAPPIPGDTMLAKRQWAEEQVDSLRRVLIWEPRGHADMYGCFLTEPVTPTADFGILFIHNAGFSTMCGHGIIAATKVVLDSGMLATDFESPEVIIDAPAGLIRARATRGAHGVESVAFLNVPSFAAELDARIEVPELGQVTYDLAFGGAFYAFVDAPSLGLSTGPDGAQALIEAASAIKGAITADRTIVHPEAPDLGFLYGVVFVGPAADPKRHSRNVCVFADGEVDRSPTGTGVSARVAIHHARGEIGLDEAIEVESIVGSSFRGRAVEEARCGSHSAVIPEIVGRAWISGRHEFFLDPTDGFPEGFFLR